MDINDLRKIGGRLKDEIPAQMEDLLKGEAVGRGAGGDMTHPIDKKTEDMIFEELEKTGEALTVVSEEYGTMDIRGGGPKLLIDPIDGSRNALSGVPMFSTSIALIDGDTIGKTSVGYIVNLATGDEYWAVKGGGSFLNGMRISTQEENSFKVIAYEAQSPKADIPKITPLLSLFNRARCFGSTALDMAFLAQGAVSMSIIPYPSRSFDFAAGYLLVKEAGGIITDIKGQEIGHIKAGLERSTPLLASGNRELHEKALETLK